MGLVKLPWVWKFCIAIFILFVCNQKLASASDYLIGLGSHDITGPASDVNMMGYANMDQTASGIHFRLRARAFIVAESQAKRVLFVNLDACMASQIVTLQVIERLKSRYGDLYTEENTAISGIHTHAGPGGYLQYIVYIITSLGFVRQSFEAIVNGIEQSVIQAHNSLRPGSIFINKGDLMDAGVNRSPSAYLNNPEEERLKFATDVDKEMTLLKFIDKEIGPVGSFNWFPTHGTSMSRTNSLISGDNKGAAARFMEDWYANVQLSSKTEEIPRRISISETEDELVKIAALYRTPGGKFGEKSTIKVRENTEFVSAFCQSNCGDVSPNTLGAFCIDSDLSCDFNHSTCGGMNELCYSRGPGYPDEFESTRIIGERQFKKAAELFNEAAEEIAGDVDYRHSYIDFSNLEVSLNNGDVAKTCPAAMGFAFAAGTSDGPGAFDFKQGDDTGNAFWKLVRNVLKEPSKEQEQCHSPKPILLDTGEMKEPYQWAPSIVPVQILRVGQLVILCAPGEFTTMAGRRLRDAVSAALAQNGTNTTFHVVIAGLTNTYSQYITTFEEYQIQRYESASTLFGPHTLDAYIQEFKKLCAALSEGKKSVPGPRPPDLLNKQISMLPPVVLDTTPAGTNFGDCKSDTGANGVYKRGVDTVSVEFWSACPRNDLRTEGSFAVVERLETNGKWVGAYDDDDFSLRFIWRRPSKLSTHSMAAIEWRIPATAYPAVYRISHYGSAKNLLGKIRHFNGSSSAFVVFS